MSCTLIEQALQVCEERAQLDGGFITSSRDTREHLAIWFGSLDPGREHFAVMALTTRNQLIDKRILFEGTISKAHVYPREVFRYLLAIDNCGAFIIAHNHPSGDATPSGADIAISKVIRDTAKVLDIEFLDSLVIAGADVISLAEERLI